MMVMLNYRGEYCDECQSAVRVIRSSDMAMKFCIEQLVSLKVPPAVPPANLVGDAFGNERKSVDG